MKPANQNLVALVNYAVQRGWFHLALPRVKVSHDHRACMREWRKAHPHRKTTGKRWWTGLSAKELGIKVYRRMYYVMNKTRTPKPEPKPRSNWWTGLSNKTLGHKMYMRLYRQFCATRNELLQ